MRNERFDRSDSSGLEALIDEAAHRLVAGEPSSALRTSVRTRIGQRRSTGTVVPILAGAVALLVVSVIVGRALLEPSGRADTVRVTNDGPAIERTSSKTAPREPDVAPTQLAQTEPRQLSRSRAAVTPPPAVEEESLIPPISIAPLTTAQIAVEESSGVTPIDIAPLQIEPLLGQ